MADITFEEVIKLVDQLSFDDRQKVIQYLKEKTQPNELTVEEKMALLRSVQIHMEINEVPSPRREDWYGDDGR